MVIASIQPPLCLLENIAPFHFAVATLGEFWALSGAIYRSLTGVLFVVEKIDSKAPVFESEAH
jgi:hypothetical protein